MPVTVETPVFRKIFIRNVACRGAKHAVYVQGLPETYWQEYAKNISAVTAEDLVRVAKKYVDLDNMAIVIVGDREVIEPKLRATGIAPIVLLNVDGKPVVTP